jgi:hypothetical protein
VVTAAVTPLELLCPGALANAVAGHRSAEPGHQALLERLGKQPLLDLGMRLGEASGALGRRPPAAPGRRRRHRGRHLRRLGPIAVNGFLGAVSFLTRVPTGTGTRRPEELAGFVPWFPAVGAGVGLAVAAVYVGAGQLLPPLPAAEPGRGRRDPADRGVPRGRPRRHRRRLRRRDRPRQHRPHPQDPRLGTFGVLAVAASLLLRVAAVAALAPVARPGRPAGRRRPQAGRPRWPP